MLTIAGEAAAKADWSMVFLAIVVGLAALIGSIFTGLGTWISAFFNRETEKIKRIASVDESIRWAQILLQVDSFRMMPFVERVLLFQGSNGNGAPESGKPYTVYCIYGWAQNPELHPQHSYDFRLKIDDHWKDVLTEIISKQKSLLTVAEMPADSQLRRYYSREGIRQSSLHFISTREGKLIYLSCGSYTAEYTSQQVEQIELVAERMRAIAEN